MSPDHEPSPTAQDQQVPFVLLTHDRYLRRRIVLHTRARYLLCLVLVVGTLFAQYVIGIKGLDVLAFVWLAIAIALYNSVLLTLAQPHRKHDDTETDQRFLRSLLLTSVFIDYIALTVTIWLFGGVCSPFLSFYLFHLVITSFLLSRRAAAFSTLLAITFLTGLVIVEYTDILPAPHPEGLWQHGDHLDPRYVVVVLTVNAALFVLTSLLATSLAQVLRRAELANREKNRQLEQLSTMRREFLLVALHDLHSPVGVITMLIRNLRVGVCGPLEPKQIDQLDRSLKHLVGLEEFLQDLRMLSQLETPDITQHKTEIQLDELLAKVAEQEQDLAHSRGHTLTVETTDNTPPVHGVSRLIREALINYITNAIKYTPEGGTITARVRTHKGMVRIEVQDTGVGITTDDQARLFKEFVRVGRDNPIVKQAKGTGLGLSLVRRIIETHHGRVGVESTPGRGSTFWLELPIYNPPTPTDASS